MGSLRGKRTRKQLLRRQHELVDNMVHVINLPTPKLYHDKLERLTKDLDDRRNKFAEDDIFVREFAAIKGSLNVEAKPEDELDAELEEIDPRLRYVAFLREFRRDMEEVVDELANVTDETMRIERARFFGEAYQRKGQELTKEADKEVQFKSPVLTIGTFVLAALASPVVERIGGWLWVGFGTELK
jgi:hypothetical protein